MSGAESELASDYVSGVLPKGRSPLAHLLHALNQPLTGLQCSLELALAGPRPAEQYVRTLREGLELTGRMRILVEAVRELADIEQSGSEAAESLPLEVFLRDTVGDLLPVAETKSVRLLLENQASLPMRAARSRLTSLLFRFLESVLSLTRERGEVRIVAAQADDGARLAVTWNPGPPPEHSPFSRQELGLLIVQAAWERLGAEWSQASAETSQTCTVRLRLASLRSPSQPARIGDSQ